MVKKASGDLMAKAWLTCGSKVNLIDLTNFISTVITGGPDVEYDLIHLVCWRLRYDFGRLKLKTMYGNASKIAVNAACGK